MPLNTQKCIAGLTMTLNEFPKLKANWKLFSSMVGAGKFRQEVIQEDKIGNALDAIPLHGKVSQSQFNKYCEAFSAWTDPLATATRLLAIKRPDLFVCIDSKNREELSKFLKVPKSQLTLRTYWKQILERIYNSDWFVEKPFNPTKQEEAVKKFQVAMIDSFCYDPNKEK